jgi:hypothetical protein
MHTYAYTYVQQNKRRRAPKRPNNHESVQGRESRDKHTYRMENIPAYARMCVHMYVNR